MLDKVMADCERAPLLQQVGAQTLQVSERQVVRGVRVALVGRRPARPTLRLPSELRPPNARRPTVRQQSEFKYLFLNVSNELRGAQHSSELT